MPTDPNNTRYPAQYSQGDDGWGSDMSNNLDQLAVDVPAAGPIADRPSATADFAPEWYYATDEQLSYRNTGSAWDVMPADGFRRLSSFDTLQAAADWSDSSDGTPGAVLVDGSYDIDEPTVQLRKSSHIIGMGIHFSELNHVRDTTDPMFRWSSDFGLQQHTWMNLSIKDTQSTPRERPAFKPDSSWSGSFGRGTVFRDLYLEDVGGVYPFEIRDAYWATVDNLAIRTANSSPTGHFKFVRCNACNLSSVKSLHNTAQDNATPSIYLVACNATGLNSPHVEHLTTDTAIQISRGVVTVKDMHVEGNTPDNPADYHCCLQIGDGGLTRGNTNGSTGLATVTLVGGVTHGSSASAYEGIRILNADDFVAMGVQLGGSPQYNYRGSNQHSQSELTTDVRSMFVMGDNDAEITNSSSESSPPILNFMPNVQTSDTDLSGNLNNFDLQWGHGTSGGSHSMAYKDESGTVHVWDANRTL